MPNQDIHLSILDPDGTVREERIPPGAYLFGRDVECQIRLQSQEASRRHARVIFDHDGFTVEDLGSTSGTWVKGQRISSTQRFAYPCVVDFGNVRVSASDQPIHAPPAPRTAEMPVPGDDEFRISLTVDASGRTGPPIQGLAEQTAKRLELLYDLPLQFAAEPDLKKLYRLILGRVMELIPGAKRGALLIIESHSGKLAVRASIPEETPPVSRTLIRRAAQEQQGFIWGDEHTDGRDLAMSIVALHIRTGMYVPLLWKGQTLGVLCVDNPKHRAAFRPEDLQFMVSVAHYAASAVANQLLQDDIEQNNRTLQHLLTNFSPKLRGKLLQKARDGRLQPGGEKSVVTILFCDLRGFTRVSALVDSEVVMAMLNDYFSILGDLVFLHDGTIDKFIGDAILAVFGSPEADEQHPLKAVTCAKAMIDVMGEINARRLTAGLPCCELGIGVYTGEVLHGFIGPQERLEFTVIGDTVNKAARLCDGAGPGEIVLGALTYEAVKSVFKAEAKTIDTKHEGGLEAWVTR